MGLCTMIVLSYFFSLVQKAIRMPSVLLLLGTGMLIRWGAHQAGYTATAPRLLLEALGTIGLIMIVLEASLDLEIRKQHLKLIRAAFTSALGNLLVSAVSITGLLYWYFGNMPIANCAAYALALSVVSSAIVMPSVHHLNKEKREFLIYESAFSDILGIMAFNFLAENETIGLNEISWFVGSIPVSLVLSVVLCLALIFLLVRSHIQVKYFLIFAMIIMAYVFGKWMHLPSLIAVMGFGLVVNNWEFIPYKPLKKYASDDNVQAIADLLRPITAESAFLIRTFFFLIFGFNLNPEVLLLPQVLWVGGAVVISFVVLRFFYLRILHRERLLPELFYIPRGLVTVLLFYKIPDRLKIPEFEEGVLFFVILVSSLVLMLGSILYKDNPVERGPVVEE